MIEAKTKRSGVSKRTLWCVLLAAAVLSTVPFWLTDLDIRASALFYTPMPAELGREASWPLGQSTLFNTLYVVGSALSWLVLVVTMLAYALPGVRKRPLLRQIALTTLATVALGTGLFVNGLGKDFTGRPRPRTIEEFGGHSQYRAPLQLGTPGVGKSFPCGHCSAGYAVGAVGLALLAARPALGTGIILASIVFGLAMGAARMAAGAHFLSDVLWSGILTWLAALGAHSVLTRLRNVHEKRGWPPWLTYLGVAALSLAVVAGLLFTRPFHHQVRVRVPVAAMPAQWVFDTAVADLDIAVDPHAVDAVAIDGEIKGFGFPNVRVKETETTSGTRVVRHIAQTGTTKEIDAPMKLTLRPEAIDHVEVNIGTGNVKVLDARYRARILPRVHIRNATAEAQ